MSEETGTGGIPAQGGRTRGTRRTRPDEANAAYPARYWHSLDDGRIQCDLCPRECRLRDGQRGFCFVRMRQGERTRPHDVRPLVRVLHRPDREEAAQPLLPRQLGAVLRDGRLQPRLQVLPELGHLEVPARWTGSWTRPRPRPSRRRRGPNGCRSVAFTYNDPVIFAEYADRRRPGLPRAGPADRRRHGGLHRRGGAARPVLRHGRGERRPQGVHRRLLRAADRGPAAPVLDTLAYLWHETDVWVEITTLLIPGHNDSDEELRAMFRWVARRARRRTCRTTSPPSTPTTGCATCRRRRSRPSSGPATSPWPRGCATSTPATSTTRAAR